MRPNSIYQAQSHLPAQVIIDLATSMLQHQLLSVTASLHISGGQATYCLGHCWL